jgi:hypothetical protein
MVTEICKIMVSKKYNWNRYLFFVFYNVENNEKSVFALF